MKRKGVRRCISTDSLTYDESCVAHDLSLKTMLFIELMCNQVEANKSYGELIQTKNALAQFGFTNSKNTELLGKMSTQMADYKKAKGVLLFMESVWEKFGTDAMVVRYDHFFEILEKYDMVCGSFDRYLGGIPQFVLNVLVRLNEMWESKELTTEYALGLNYAKSLILKDETTGIENLKKRLRIPLRTDNEAAKKAINSYIGFDMGKADADGERDSLTDVLFIAAPAADMQPIEMSMEFETERLKELRAIKPESSADLDAVRTHWIRTHDRERAEVLEQEIEFLSSKVLQEMGIIEQKIKDEENRLKEIVTSYDLNRYAKIEFIHKEADIIRVLKDPFICSLTPYGVLIHAKWGAEAEDSTIKRYEQLCDAVIGKGGQA